MVNTGWSPPGDALLADVDDGVILGVHAEELSLRREQHRFIAKAARIGVNEIRRKEIGIHLAGKRCQPLSRLLIGLHVAPDRRLRPDDEVRPLRLLAGELLHVVPRQAVVVARALLYPAVKVV